MTMKYELKDDKDQVISTHATYFSAYDAAEKYAGDEAVVGHDGDLDGGGDRTLVWDRDEAAENDSGEKAIAVIRIC